MGKNLLIVIALLFFTASVCLGQDEAQVMEPVNQLFEGMRTGDSAMVHRVFHHSARMTSVKTDGTITDDALAGFLKAIGTPHTEVWNEVIWKPVVQVDGTFAQVWTPYAFYVGKRFSHCGVDAFQLVKTAAGWKIFQLSDTRRKEKCEIPEEISKRFK
ncbi:MAG: nuclear transport factor 2 family protein [Cyclobacteriaceae bacterium]|jgi:hypothetical protein|nr:hypothetical protein [Cytophagales bacterium]HNP79106.1 nuclear transport factor 2 family protein [Cyclobacteriaceae bacterium]